MMSHVFKRDAELSEEQSCVLCEYLGLGHAETDFFILLVQYARAGSQKLRDLLKKRIEEKREIENLVESKIKNTQTLSDEDKSIYYSSWHYSAIRLLANLSKGNDIDKLLDLTGLPRAKLLEMTSFLVETQVLEQNEDQSFKTGISKVHVSKDSAHVWKHHQNWRLKTMERYHQLDDDELFFTSPLTIAKKDIPIIKDQILNLIEKVSETVTKSEEEELCCLNIDWVCLSGRSHFN
jgi:uncharacterized protein (TIGR02147 family)